MTSTPLSDGCFDTSRMNASPHMNATSARPSRRSSPVWPTVSWVGTKARPDERRYMCAYAE
jgi:hypothetical protein